MHPRGTWSASLHSAAGCGTEQLRCGTQARAYAAPALSLAPPPSKARGKYLGAVSVPV